MVDPFDHSGCCEAARDGWRKGTVRQRHVWHRRVPTFCRFFGGAVHACDRRFPSPLVVVNKGTAFFHVAGV
jgi:hypothetical protein